MSQAVLSSVASVVSAAVAYEGTLAGLVSSPADEWFFEGVAYDTPADEATIVETVNEALSEPTSAEVKAAQKLLFGGDSQYTSQLLMRLAVAYEAECGDDGTGVQQVKSILVEAARRIAVIEALSI